jgi:nicotinate-nucleotide adenylyltransferase
LPAPEPSGPERIGILGGTFDPPHIGHVAAARAVVAALDLDRLLLVVANDPWQKSHERRISPAEDRLALTQAMAAGIVGAEVSRVEIDRGGPSYSVETAEQILASASRPDRPTPQLFLVVGADLVPDLDCWERAEDLKGLVTVAIVSRPTDPAPEVPAGWSAAWVNGPEVDVSSSEVRARLQRGEPIDEIVPPEVVRCIGRRNLYAVG